MFGTRLIILGVALAIDLLLGDPPNAFHPTAWIGSLISFFSNRAPKSKTPAKQFLYGTAIFLLGGLIVGSIIFGLELIIQTLPYLLSVLLMGILLKTTFTLRGLINASDQISKAFQADDLKEARRLISWHLVSRDTTSLTASQASAAAIESVAENTSDSIIAPIFYFLVFGLPGAFVYRFVNTSDSILGYRNEKYEWLGKTSARMDDLINLIPARISALLFLLSAPISGGSFFPAIKVWWADHRKTESPNAGHPMSAAAGVLEIKLEKVSHYVLGENHKYPQPHDLKRMVRLMVSAIVIGVLLTIIIQLGIRGL